MPMTAVTQLTYSGIGLAVFARQLCLPVPAVLFLMTAGALAAQGQLHISLLLVAGVLGCLAGDGVWFWMGRRWGSQMIRLVCSLTLDPRTSMKRSRHIFDQWGLRILVVAKFVPGLDGAMPPLVGAEGASVTSFLSFDGAGSLLWTSAYVMLGFVFSHQLESAVHGAERFGSLLAVVLGVPLVLYIVWRLAHLVRMVRHLRLRRISPELLQRKLNESDRVAIFDLLHYEAREGEIAGIPGAVRIDPARLRSAPHFVVPDDVDIVLYCSSRNEFVSARVAEALQKRGIKNVWVLEGGLDAWVREGRPITMTLSEGEEVAARLGIVVPERA